MVAKVRIAGVKDSSASGVTPQRAARGGEVAGERGRDLVADFVLARTAPALLSRKGDRTTKIGLIAHRFRAAEAAGARHVGGQRARSRRGRQRHQGRVTARQMRKA